MGLDADCPFRAADAALADLKDSRIAIVDITPRPTVRR
jgi:hypothetical protein